MAVPTGPPSATAGIPGATVGTFSDPSAFANNIVWHNRKFFFFVDDTSGCNPTDPTCVSTFGLCQTSSEDFAVVVDDERERARNRVTVGAKGKPGDQGDEPPNGIVGRHPKMRQLLDTIRKVGPLDVPVAIEGESGTGKEMAAMALHRESPRAARRIVPVNCGALAEGLLESELFGHVKGAHSAAQCATRRDVSSSRTAVPCFSTRSPSSPTPCRSSSCAFFRTASSSGSAASSR